jgi:tetratricopeptide (TPR) repeat protein
MPAHTYIRTGDYLAAAKNNALAAQVDRVYAQKAEKEGSIYDLMYHSHNEHFLAMAASMAGNYAEAKAAADGLAKRLAPHAKTMLMLDGFMSTPLWVDARFGKWDAILARPEPAKELLATHVMWRYTRALAYAATGNLDKASAERGEFAAEAARVPADVNFGEQNSAKDIMGVAGHILDARIAMAQGNKADAIGHLRQAVMAQDALNYDEPADWYYPVRESLGAVFLAAGQATEAEQVFREDLVRNPRNPRSLFGLMQSLKAEQKEADAAWVERQFKTAWKGADTKLQISDL